MILSVTLTLLALVMGGIGCGHDVATSVPTATDPPRVAGFRLIQVFSMVRASNAAQTDSVRRSDSTGGEVLEYLPNGDAWKKHYWDGRFLGYQYAHLGDDWTDIWLVMRIHKYLPGLNDAGRIIYTDRWLVRENTQEVYFLDLKWTWSISYVSDDDGDGAITSRDFQALEERGLRSIAESIRDGTLKPNPD